MPQQQASSSNPALHYETVGSGPAVLFVHGMDDDSTIWSGTVRALADDCASTTVDLVGHGQSPAPETPAAYEREAVLDSLDVVLDSIGPAVLVGHSLGGFLGLAHHLTRPGILRGLVLVATGPGFRNPEAMARWNRRVHEQTPVMGISPTAAAIGLHTDSLVIDRLHEVTIPVGLVVGSKDKGFLGANDYMERKLTDVRRHTVEGGRHRVMITHPRDVANMVRKIVAISGTPHQPQTTHHPQTRRINVYGGH